MSSAQPQAAGMSRIERSDIAVAAVMTVLGTLLMVANVGGPPTGDDEGAVYHVGAHVPRGFAIPLFAVVTLPLLWRRVAPDKAASAAFAGLLVNEALLGSEFIRCGVLLPTAMLISFSAGAHPEARRGWVGLAGCVALVMTDFGVTFGLPTAFIASGLVTVVWGIGRVARSRRQLAVELAARTEELREARDSRAGLEVAAERARVSNELDALLQRRLGELAAMAEQGAEAPGAMERLAAIEHASRATLEEMRSLVGVLRHDAEYAPTAPQPTLTHLEGLLTRTNGAGARFTVAGDPRTLPPAVELSAFRVLEHLLDALDDAPGVEVQVTFAENTLELSLSGPARRGAAEAIDRARERVRLHHGTLEATLRRGRAEAQVSLPVHAMV
jgi:signal transduction histidine kinase